MDREIVFGRRLKALRKQRGLLQNDLAEVLGVKQNTMSHYENSRNFPDIESLLTIARYFNVTLDSLVLGKEDDVIDFASPTPEFSYEGMLLPKESKKRIIEQAYLESLRQKAIANH